MPVRTPSGTATTLAERIKKALPMIALLIPPPVSPTGAGSFVRKFQLIEVSPFLEMKKSMKNMGRMEQNESSTTMAWNARSTKILLLSALSLISCLEACLYNDDLSDDVDDRGDYEKKQRKLYQTGKIDLARGFRELIGNNAGHGVGRAEDARGKKV